MLLSTISSRSQTTIPKDILSFLDAGPGDRLSYEINEGEIVLRKQPSLSSLAGALHDKRNAKIDLNQAIDAARNDWSRHCADEGEL